MEKSKRSCYLLKVLVLGQKLILGKPLNCAFKLVKWFPLQHQPLDAYLKIHTTRFAIFMINICIYNHPFKVFMNRKYEGLKISRVAKLERPIDSGDFSCKHGFDDVPMK